MGASEQIRHVSSTGYRRSRNIEKWFTIAFFLVPAAIVYIWLVILPVIRAVQFSLYQWNGLGPLTDFVGLITS